jgi:dTDP-4-dehydrorhamnose 3,5-epimerase-like enzyme
MTNQPYKINFPALGSLELGYLGIAESQKQIPFEIKRVFWAYYTPDSVLRGRHAHHNTEMVLIAVSGRIVLTTEMPSAEPAVFVLDKPNLGVYMPSMCWHTMQYSHNAVQLVLASTEYNEEDYIRSYDGFLKASMK